MGEEPPKALRGLSYLVAVPVLPMVEALPVRDRGHEVNDMSLVCVRFVEVNRELRKGRLANKIIRTISALYQWMKVEDLCPAIT